MRGSKIHIFKAFIIHSRQIRGIYLGLLLCIICINLNLTLYDNRENKIVHLHDFFTLDF